MADIELKPCPFCGDNQQLNYVELSNGLHYIECARCGAAPHRLGARDRETAVKYWNSVSRWIPCNERLPEVGIPVLIYDKHHKAFFVAKLDEDYFGFSSNMWHHPADVLFWMPLPEPPKEAEKR